MNKDLRSRLRNIVTQCRALLEQAVGEALQGRYGIHASGLVEDARLMIHLSEEEQTYRAQLVAYLDHMRVALRDNKTVASDSVEQLKREIAFTHLNRLCAFKMMERRKLIRESVSNGVKSQGFLFYLAEQPNDELLVNEGHLDVAYRHYLEWLGGRFASQIPFLFLPTDPANRLYPPQRVLDQVISLLGEPKIDTIWNPKLNDRDELNGGEETIGWVYQYFTPGHLRQKVREESPTPRNAYEMAFRNQFYTPQYVVHFLVENTLGRVWYEMRRGETQLSSQCQYLIRHANELFLHYSETPPTITPVPSNASLQDRLSVPVIIPCRVRKDPRHIRVIDPACGSGHFLLYAFDVLVTIYLEAYEDKEINEPIVNEFPTVELWCKAIPGLILYHNLNGIDIDLRATQMAALALWLKAQSYFQKFAIKAEERPEIRKANIVWAAPLPGEEELRKEFIAELHPPLLGQLVASVFREMENVNEIGSLLKIEAHVQESILKAKKQWQLEPRTEQLSLFPAERRLKPEQMTLFDVAGITDESFWQEAEGRVIEALSGYASRSADEKNFVRQLFVEDTAQGFAFIDLCLQFYDVVLMNPPFGEASRQAKPYIDKQYPRTKNDIYAAFVERWVTKLTPRGLLGAITSRTGFFLSSFQKWREEILLNEAHPTVVVDLGYRVLDETIVQTAAYVLYTVL